VLVAVCIIYIAKLLIVVNEPFSRGREVGFVGFVFSECIYNRRSSEIQGTALGTCLQAWPVYRSMPAGIAQSSHAFVGGSLV